MKSLLIIFTALVISGAVAILAVIAIALFTVQSVSKTPTTYHTGLYVESEQVQQTVDAKELQ